MRRKYLYIFLLIGLVLLVGVKHRNLFTSETVEPGSEAGDYGGDWFSIISREVNTKKIRLLVDEKEIAMQQNPVVMSETGDFMIPVSALTDAFSCVAHIYDHTNLVIEKNMVRVEISPTVVDGALYIPVTVIEENLLYQVDWNGKERILEMHSGDAGEKILPAAYDYRNEGRAPKVKNQGVLGTCWSFASLMALESRLLPEESFDFSEDHMSRQNSFHMSQNDGGEYTMSMAYLLAWQGPILESDDVYGDNYSPRGLPPVKHVQSIQVLPEKDYESIKESVYFYGGVQSSLYTSMVTAETDSEYYNKEKNAYYYTGTTKPNHDVVIVGWDDNYAKENFNQKPEGDGAFICANSWGGEFGEEGYFYVSYYDTNIGIHNILYRRVDSPDNYDKIYQSDLCGWVGQLGYGKENAYFANVYEADADEELMAAGFYAIGEDTSYEIYTVTNVEGSNSFSGRVLAASGMLKHSGYYTIDFAQPVKLNQGERFAVIVNITTPGSVHPVAIEYNAPDKTTKVDLNDGEGYISFRGSSWERVEDMQNCNICLKAYTREVGKDGE
ncbi:MAG: lectin like domain-containing protein [Clostridium sp.]